MEKEQWKNVVGYEGLYRVSNMGRIKRMIGYQCKTERILKPSFCNGNRYPQVILCKNGKTQNKKLHHLVLEAFRGQRPTFYHECRHLDGNSRNSRLINLQWGTKSENVKDAIKHGTRFQSDCRGSKNGRSKLTETDVQKIKKILSKNSMTQKAIGQLFGISEQTIHHIKNGDTWRHIDG